MMPLKNDGNTSTERWSLLFFEPFSLLYRAFCSLDVFVCQENEVQDWQVCYVEEEHCGSYCLDLLMLYLLVVSIGIQRFLSSCHCPLLKVWLKPRLYVRRKITGVIHKWVIHKWCVNAVITQYSKYRYDDVMIYVYSDIYVFLLMRGYSRSYMFLMISHVICASDCWEYAFECCLFTYLFIYSLFTVVANVLKCFFIWLFTFWPNMHGCI